MTTREKILREALDQFNEKGIHHVGVREIARALNISPGNMSYHFPKKEDLLFELLRNYSSSNRAYRQEYLHEEITLQKFIELFRRMFKNQYQHRGIFTELVQVGRLLSDSTAYNYSEGQQERVNDFERIISALQESGQLVEGETNRQYLLSFLTLFGRFWISEALLFQPNAKESEVIEHYIDQLRHQLMLYATESGKKLLQP